MYMARLHTEELLCAESSPSPASWIHPNAVIPADQSAPHRNTFLASRGWLSFGQYGHLNRLPLPSRFSDSSAMTCPHGIIIGGFWSVACSFDTGHTKIEWKR